MTAITRCAWCQCSPRRAKRCLSGPGFQADKINTIVLIDKGEVFLRSEAIFRAMSGLPAPWRWMGILRIFPQSFRDMCYNRIAINRYRLFGRYDAVQKLDADHAQRFLD